MFVLVMVMQTPEVGSTWGW